MIQKRHDNKKIYNDGSRKCPSISIKWTIIYRAMESPFFAATARVYLTYFLINGLKLEGHEKTSTINYH